MLNPFLYEFYFKQFSLAWIHSLIFQNISILSYTVYSNSSNSANSAYKYVFCLQTVKCQNSSIQFSVYTVSMSKTVPFQAIEFSQTVLIQTIQFSISMQFSSI